MVWKIQDTDANGTFRLVNAAFLAYLEIENLDSYGKDYKEFWYKIDERGKELIYNLTKKHFKKINPNFNLAVDMLENPYHAENHVKKFADTSLEKIVKYSKNYKKGGIFITDSGGLQLYRAKIGQIKESPDKILQTLYDKIFPTQAKSHFAMAFDHIVDSFTYQDIKKSALKTVDNIKDQLKIFDDVGGQASLLPIFSPMKNFKALQIWEDVLIDNLPWDNERLQSGIAFGATHQVFDKNIVLYYIANIFRIKDKLKQKAGIDLPYLHLLGVLDKKEIPMLIAVVLSGHMNVLSSDSRSYTMSFVMGRANRYNGNGHLIKYGSLGYGNTFKDLMLDSVLLFEDIIKEYYPNKKYRNINNFYQAMIDYYILNKKTDEAKIIIKIFKTLETYASMIHTIMKYIHELENEYENYKNQIEICQDYNNALKIYENFRKHFIKKEHNINIHELI